MGDISDSGMIFDCFFCYCYCYCKKINDAAADASANGDGFNALVFGLKISSPSKRVIFST